MRTLTSKKLREALELFGPNGENWCKGEYFQDRKGRFCDKTEASSFCSLGVVAFVTEKNEFNILEEEKFLRKTLHRLIGEEESELDGTLVHRWNDAKERTFDDVRALFLKAAATAEAEEIKELATSSV